MDYLDGLQQSIQTALHEDIGAGDLTANLIDRSAQGVARVITRQAAIVCGKAWVDEVFRQVDAAIKVHWHVADGDQVTAEDTLFIATGAARSILTAERTALNFLQLLSGTATKTRSLVELVAGTGVRLLDTRKTIPGLRLAQKYAVHVGGGKNHRAGLYDAILIKENHIKATGSIAEAISRARQIDADVRVQVEVENLAELKEAISARPDWIMLDNFSLVDLDRAVKEAKATGIKLEASGGIENPEDLLKIATSGVDYISIGALTKHCEAIDLSMRFE